MLNNSNLLPIEIEHYNYLSSVASECTLFLKRNNNDFPIFKPCDIALFGGGVRHTYKGGSGSGDVNSHYFNNIETEFINSGFNILNKEYLDNYDKHVINRNAKFVKSVILEAKEKRISAPAYSIGQNPYEINDDIDISIYKGDIAIYVLNRISGEGSDRKPIKGDYYLTDKEIYDISYLAKAYKKFLLVLNVSGPVDISPILDKVDNILLLSQLGIVTSITLINIILGKDNPGGKLSDTWASLEDYAKELEFGDKDDTRYLEDIYVGYRYFKTINKKALFPFGYGLSYSSFEIKYLSHKVTNNIITLKVNVNNISDYLGKEVVQLYLSRNTRVNNPSHILVGFFKTNEIKPHSNIDIELEFDLSKFPNFDEELSSYILYKGDYILSIGNSSESISPILDIKLDQDYIIEEVKNMTSTIDKPLLNIKSNLDISKLNLPIIKLDYSKLSTIKHIYRNKYIVDIPEYINTLSRIDLIHMNMGDYKKGLAGIIGQSCSLVVGGAGETTLKVKTLDNALAMADGPAGLRIMPTYKLNHKGTYNLVEDSIWKGIKPYLPSIIIKIMDPSKNHKKAGSVVYQYATAIPIATALAQSYNPELIYNIGRLVAKEMEAYNVDIWLAPGMNIHRYPLCGRNFEYYSEDSYLTSVIASNMVKGVQSLNKKVTVKHYLCNNQETNRFNSNSIVSIRALREIYLYAFKNTLIDSRPFSVMTSYNLVNGIHVSSSKELVTNILREEIGYEGLIMTDWITTGQINDKSSKYPPKRATHDLSNGVNIVMPGSKKDVKDIKKGLKRGEITISDLKVNASILYKYLNS